LIVEYPQARVLVFAKAPIPGQVKTRLTGKYGEQGAARLHSSLLRRILSLLKAARLCRVTLCCSPDTKHALFLACRRDYGVELCTQKGADLGQRMLHAFAKTLAETPLVLLIGSDCASLGVGDLRSALLALAAGKDAVLGPAEDGGYLLLGLSRLDSSLFRRIHWGSGQVLAATRRRLRRAGFDWLELPSGWDVDYPADVRRLRRQSTISWARRDPE
jgi:rSAM/selenodomain-associated transferase 1